MLNIIKLNIWVQPEIIVTIHYEFVRITDLPKYK